jgi:hypothetical protein
MQRGIAVIGFVLLGIQACSRPTGPDERDLIPDHYGVFVTDGARLRELSSISHTQVTQTSEGTGAEEFETVLNHVDETVSFVSYGFDQPVLARAASPGKSRRYRLAQTVLLDVEPANGRRDMLRFRPRLRLERGPYLLSVRGCLENGWNRRCYYSFAID